MNFEDFLFQNSNELYQDYLQNISLDCVILGFHEGELKVLLIKIIKEDKDFWCIPGGFIKKDESLESAAKRVLLYRTGLEDIFLEQFSVFGDLNRSEDLFSDYSKELFQNKRFISIGFYALVDFTKYELQKEIPFSICKWVSIDEIPELVIDHEKMLNLALKTLRLQLSYKPIGYNLLPDKFTLSEFQKLYEIILGKKLNRGNFYKQIMSYNILIKHRETKKTGTPNKPPFLYSFDLEKYNKFLSDI